MLRTDRAVVVGEVQGDVVAGLHGQERPKRPGVAEAEDLGQELRRFALVTDAHDGVIQFNAHRYSLTALDPATARAACHCRDPARRDCDQRTMGWCALRECLPASPSPRRVR